MKGVPMVWWKDGFMRHSLMRGKHETLADVVGNPDQPYDWQSIVGGVVAYHRSAEEAKRDVEARKPWEASR